MTKPSRKKTAGERASPKRRTTTRRTQEERTSATTAKILAATRDCILELGYVGTTMSAIAKKAGVTHGAVQHHYGSRANVFKALIEQFFGALNPLEEPTAGTTAKQQRDDFLKDSFHFYGTALPVAILLLRVNVQAEPELREVIEAKFSPLNTLRDKVWNRLFQAAGLLPREADLMREIMIAMLRGLAVRHAYRRKIGPIDSELSIVTEMVELYIAKLGNKRHGRPY